MSVRVAPGQPDLFAPAMPDHADQPPELVERYRAELHATVDRMRAANGFADCFAGQLGAVLAESAFRGRLATWLAPAESAALWAAFDREMDRLYALENARLGFLPDGETPLPRGDGSGR